VNRFSGFQRHAKPFGEVKTAKAVKIPSARMVTPLKRDVNERGVIRGRRICEMLGLSFALTVWLCLLAGCSSFQTEMGRPLSAETNNFAEARTRVDTVVHELGPPHQVSRLPDGFVFLYEYSRISEFQLGFSMNVPIVRWLKFLKAWNQLEHQSLVLTFDQQGVLRGEGSGNLQQSLGGGGGVQFLFAVMSFSDVSDFLRPAEAHGWGETLLQPLPVALNSDESLRSGEHGLQQRIAPDYAGQHTLEMTQPKTEKEKKRIKKNYQMPPP
jgi:hypothetical protein